MCFFVGFPQPFCADMRVNLRRCQTFVPEKLLNTAEVCTAVQEMRGKAVPQGMRGGLL